MNYLDEAVTKSLDEFMEYYKVVDTENIYSIGIEFVPIFRVKQWEEYNNKGKEIERLNKCYCERTDCSGRIKNSKKYESVQEENERLHSIIKEAINYIDDNTYYKDHKGHINIDDLYLILQKGSESNE